MTTCVKNQLKASFKCGLQFAAEGADLPQTERHLYAREQNTKTGRYRGLKRDFISHKFKNKTSRNPNI